jgi:hypothetical protein
VTTVKQVCLGVAVAGAVAGAGSVVAAATASADASDSGSGAASASSSPKAGPQKSVRAKAAASTESSTASTTKTVTTKTIRPAPRRSAAAGGPVLTSLATTSSPGTVKATFDLAAPTKAPTKAPAPAPASSTTARAAAVAAVDPTQQHVLVIGVDGTNLGRILSNPANQNFFDLMDEGTTAASTIVGHTTISNPSWTAILTGVWDTKSGVISNVFTPRTYDSWPTVFNQLEGFNANIETKSIADWDVISDIAGAGSIPVDQNVYIPQIAGDADWSLTDRAVTDETIKSLQGTAGDVPNFMFSYLVQVDENGHAYGGASPEYAAAIERTDTNIGLIMDAVKARELATGEDWTVIVVTDHGHQPQQGFGHGFQSPDETSTFVIADGADFDAGQINTQYSIVDVTPTVVTLFGGTPTTDADGVSLTTLGQSQVDPVNLHQALNDLIDLNGWPDIATNITLGARTIFGAIPYYVNVFTDSITASLQSIANQGIPLVSALATVAVLPVQFIGDSLFVVTQALAEVVGRLTGAGVIPPSTSTAQPAAVLPKASVLV